MRRKVGSTKKRVSGARKTTVGKRTRRRRRVSGANDISGMLTKAGGLIVGAVAARELNTLVVKFLPSFSPLMSGAVQVGVGLLGPKFVKGAFFADVFDGMIANGGMVLVVSTGLISGPNDRMVYRINGTSNHQVVNGTGYMPTVSGIKGPAYAAVAGGTAGYSVVTGPQTRISNNPIEGPVAIQSYGNGAY